MNNIKKICAILLIGCMLVALSACGKTSTDNDNPDANDNYYENDEQDNYAENDDADSQILSSTKENGLLFSTEYTVVDYVENAIIVSKNDGLLYGVLDNNGNEVIPIKYDDMEFANKESYVKGKNENIYLIAKYESDNIILDAKGNELFQSENSLYGANSYFSTKNTPYFNEYKAYSEEQLYNENLEYIGTMSYSDFSIYTYTTIRAHAFSENCYMVKTIDGNISIYFYDYMGNIVNKFEDYSTYKYHEKMIDNEFILALSKTGDDNLTIFHIDSYGKTLNEETMTENEYIEKYEKSDSYNLYASNSTWKLEDLNGNPLLDERYYDSIDANGENECILLVNENNEVCLFSRQGKLYIDYGVLTYNNETLRMLTFDSNKTVNVIYEGKESVIIPVSSSNGGYDIYYYSAK